VNRIDAPDMKGVSKKETQMAIISRDTLAEKCLGKKVTLTEIKREKYGRVLADIHCDGIFLNEWMITEKLAVEYDGGTKAKINWKEYMKDVKK
jgi:endonuclease YncB( thermonuclease family)